MTWIVDASVVAAYLLGMAGDDRDTCSTYDGLYVALAEALITRDGRLARGTAGVIDVVLGGEME